MDNEQAVELPGWRWGPFTFRLPFYHTRLYWPEFLQGVALASAQAAPAGSQQFSGSAASRLDAFIQRANAVRAPGPGPARGQAGDGLNVQVTPSAASLKTAPATESAAPIRQTAARASASETPAPLKLASDGNTDVANWMMRALDRYESMKTQEQS